MRSFSGSVLTALAGASIGLVQLVRVELASGDLLLNSSNRDVIWDGLTYKGAFGLGSVTTIQDKSGEAQGVSLQLSGASSADIALALDAADEVQGAAVTIRTALIDLSNGDVLDAPIDWAGQADTMAIQEDGDTATVTLSAESSAVDLLRGTPSTYSHADQQALFADDRAFEYVVSQADQVVVWPSREFFFQ